MNAVEFVKKHGWGKAERAINNAPPLDDKVWYFFWCNECGNGGSSQTMFSNSYMPDYCACSVCTSEDLKSDDGDYKDLKRLVESWELVENFFNLNSLGFKKCIEIAKKQIEELESNGAIEFWHRWDDELSCMVERMKQAIADVESVGGGV
ncbi:hypothetical protein [Acinetobacter bereziniae]|uniref:hypothetical protein n=1 Tax=Acinetobacter bereziniae TaxID=106648 RepID=UPI0012502642|nr:hypothetical protein [Acinetobacter bereziniae]